MTLKNQLNKERGFTIVELLIVIVVIAILAAITIVSYNGIQNRAKATSGQNLAGQIVTKVKSFNTVLSAYPTHAQLTSNDAVTGNTTPTATQTIDVAKVDSPGNVKDGSAFTALSGTTGTVPTATDFNSGKDVYYRKCAGTTGAQVFWWDYAASTPVIKTITIGIPTTSLPASGLCATS